MITKMIDWALYAFAGLGLRPLQGLRVIPVLHVERLDDDGSFQNVMRFAKDYLDRTQKKAVMTVITPEAPLLKRQLANSGFSAEKYEERIRHLASISDVGLHGHFTRLGEPNAPVHNYWSESSLVAEQLAREIAWLEERGLMRHRAYSAGWWYLDQSVIESLQKLGFSFDFSCSSTQYGHSPVASRLNVRPGSVPFAFYGEEGTVAYVPALSGFCGSVARSFVPRRALSYWGLGRVAFTAGVYSHDWDLRPEEALRTIDDLVIHGVGFVGLDELIVERATLINRRNVSAG